MNLSALAAGSRVFIDANIFVYHFISEPQYGKSCTSFLERIERRDIEGWVTPHVLAEVSHRLMTIEACARFNWPYQGIASRLQHHAQRIQELSGFQQALMEIAQLDLRVAMVTDSHVMQAAAIARTNGLLTNDAILVAAIRGQGLSDLVSSDVAFDRVPGLTRYAPA